MHLLSTRLLHRCFGILMILVAWLTQESWQHFNTSLTLSKALRIVEVSTAIALSSIIGFGMNLQLVIWQNHARFVKALASCRPRKSWLRWLQLGMSVTQPFHSMRGLRLPSISKWLQRHCFRFELSLRHWTCPQRWVFRISASVFICIWTGTASSTPTFLPFLCASNTREMPFFTAAKVLSGVCPQWRDTVVGCFSDRENEMTGCQQACVTRFQREARPCFSHVWCGGHHFDLVLQGV